MSASPLVESEAFDSKTIETMAAALVEVCVALGSRACADQITELVAAHIVELARQGIRAKSEFVIRTIEDFKANPQ